jgi:hypothetical protein
LPGAAATFYHYTSYSRGLNGVAVDFAQPVSGLTVGDFAFRAGTDPDPVNWLPAPAPAALTILPGAGTGGANRVLLAWADGALRNVWLEVTVRATAATQLAAPDVFYFGNAVGETGNNPANAITDALDHNAVLANIRPESSPAPLNDRYDLNRDGAVNALDVAIARDNATTVFTAIPLLNLSGPPGLIGIQPLRFDPLADDPLQPRKKKGKALLLLLAEPFEINL